jgi:hypothetical protein
VGKIVLLAVAAAWAAVLLPPLLRNRMDNRPGSSVTDFRRQLSTLQRAVPTRSITPMRSMARPLAPSPLQKPAVQHRASQLPRSHGHADQRQFDPRGVDHRQAPTYGIERQHHTGELARRLPREQAHAGHRQVHLQSRQVSRREIIRRRRSNVLFILVTANALTLFLAATTKAHVMVYGFALAFVSLCGYVYKLAQLRQYEQDSRYSEQNWFNAA